MTKTTESRTIIGLDIGNQKVVAVAATVSPDGVASIQGIGTVLSRGMNHGAVVDLDAVENAVRNAILQTESMINGEIQGVTIAISGQHIGMVNESGMAQLNGIVKQKDVDSALNLARSISLDESTSILHILPQEYILDNVACKSPVGLSGMRLNAQAHLITCNQYWLRNLKNAVERCKIKVDEVVFAGYASSYSVLTDDEKERGVCLIDIGAGTMDIMVYTDGLPRFSKSIPIAGNNVTEHVAQGLYTSLAEAETLKVNYGSAMYPPLSNPEQKFEVAGTGMQMTRYFNRTELARFTSEYYHYLFQLVDFELKQLQQELKKKNVKLELIAGIVLTGGGSQIKDIVECASAVFGLQARVGYPLNIAGIDKPVNNKPQYATVLGLLQVNHYNKGGIQENLPAPDEGDVFDACKGFIKKCFEFIKTKY